jgi:glycosyltransferase involved in cell wall biosynthesis
MKQHSPIPAPPDRSLRAGRLRLAYVSPSYAPSTGGVETHVEQIARRAAAAGHQVEVLTQESDAQLPPVETIDGVLVRRFPMLVPSRNYAVAPRLWTFLAREAARFDVVHAHSYHALPALAAALAARRPLVFTPHYHGTGHSPVRRLLHRPYRRLGAAIFARARFAICVSEAEAALVRRHFPRAADRLRVIPNGVESEALRHAEPFPTDRTVILSVGRLERYKNVQAVVRALAHLPDRFVLRVIGDGPERAALEALADRLGLGDRVALLGRVGDEDLRRWYRTAAVCVAASAHEAFGLTLIEALVAGVAVVASDIPAHREVAQAHGDAITLLPPDVTPVALAEAITAAAARQPVQMRVEAASWDTVAALTLEVYRAAAEVAV